jgi:hypothetical protein
MHVIGLRFAGGSYALGEAQLGELLHPDAGAAGEMETVMSFQAYLDAIEKKTGKTPAELLQEAADRGFDKTAKAADVVGWLRTDYGLGQGHAMALYGVLKNGTEISEKHVGSSATHRDESTTLRIDGLAHR